MEDKILDIIEEFIEELYKTKLFNTSLERKIFEAEVKEKWETVQRILENMISMQQAQNDAQLLEDRCIELREQLDEAENDKADLIDRNYELAQENMRLWERISAISKVVNDTWN